MTIQKAAGIVSGTLPGVPSDPVSPLVVPSAGGEGGGGAGGGGDGAGGGGAGGGGAGGV
eukprot:CAMPEP_0169260116 /NCGR_PEP_ID=MMETSP1016-20121227/42334_1 /TAXON_ID=342587 /ORGANISM="Karlodinium micrum, Strain CCMP2283" /LENGTH=58 /DNA_ID=CAMNT_0009342217 /DNA_START=376 /DNA_END=553 /DNA_ORIENTATION=-